MRVIVTGSRTWHEPERIEQTLEDLWWAMGSAHYFGLTVVHGGCPDGADAVAHRWCQSKERVSEMVFPADWNTYGRRAGPIRNGQMVEAGADVVLAFCDYCNDIMCHRHDTEGDHVSHGTGHCIAKAEAAGIEVIEFWSSP